jgi:hypothetical protein
MIRINTPTAEADKFGAGKPGFKGGTPGLGILATKLSALFFNHVQEQICRVIEGAGLTLDEENYDQLSDAIAAMIADATPTGNFAMLDAVQAFTRAQRYTPVALVDGASIAWDLDVAPMAKVTLGGNRTMAAPTNQRDGGMFVLEVTQDGTGGRTLAWNVAYEFGVEGTPVQPTAAGKKTIYVFISNGAAMRCVGRWEN